MKKQSILWTAVAMAAVILSGCTTTQSVGPAPIIDRTSQLTTGAELEKPSMRLLPGDVEDSGRLHRVAPGDTVYNISVRYGFEPSKLQALNAISDPTQLRIGQVLKLPVSVAAPRDYVPNPNIRVTQIAGEPAPLEQPAEVIPPTTTGAQPVTLDDGVSVTSTNAGVGETPAASTDTAAEVVAAPLVPVEAKPAEPAPQVLPGARMIWPVQGKILKTFGGASKGIDIQGVMGDVVVAAMPGEIFYVGDGIAEYGWLVIVKHSPTLVSAYGHNSKIVVKVGQRVKTGEKIAELGKSGTDTPKLHFEVREKGTPVDPMMYLPRQ